MSSFRLLIINLYISNLFIQYMIKRGSKKAQGIFGLPFETIFSIIIIIAIISVATYAIIYFLSWNRCTKVGLFFDSLQDEVNRAWSSSKYINEFDAGLPSSIDEVCFGNLDNSERRFIGYYPVRNANVFLYPPENSCDGKLFSYRLEHVQINDFFCVQVSDEKISIKLEKDITDARVKIASLN